MSERTATVSPVGPHPNGKTETTRLSWAWVQVSRDLHVSLTGRQSTFTEAADRLVWDWLRSLPLLPAQTRRALSQSNIGGNWTWVVVPRQFEQQAMELLASLEIEHA